MASQLKKRDKVYLIKKCNMKQLRMKKFDNIKVGSFLIEEKIRPVNIKLQLPADAYVHLNFHILIIEPADQDTPWQKIFHCQPEEEQKFKVEKISTKKRQSYPVKWKDHPNIENLWELIKNLQNCQQWLQQFHRQD